jgi:uncharacterized protein GlcG (DUF336 family)
MLIKNSFFGLIASTLLITTSVADDSPYVKIKRLTLETANAAAMAAVQECRKKGIQITATVVDKDGTVQAVARDSLAPPISVEISRMKAYTAANFTADTSAMSERSNTAVGRVDGLVMSAGGNIISAGGVNYGAIGVSGAPAGETDEECAKAGISAIIDDLEMAD